jgi:hypothetical protein
VTQIITTVAGIGAPGWGADGIPATSTNLSNPHGVAFDAAGNLYIADTLNHRVRRVDAVTQIITTVAGIGAPGWGADGIPATSTNLSNPHGVAFDAAGNLYIADTLNHRVRQVALVTQTIIAVSSSATTSTYGDSVTFTATVTAASGSVAPTGSVEFFNGTTLLGTASVAASTGVGTSSWSITTSNLNSGTHAIHAVFTAIDNFNDGTSGTITQTVSKANATLLLTGYNGTYDGMAHQATGIAVGVFGESLSGLSLSNTTHTNAGTYIDTVTFTDVTGNYKNTIKNVKSTIYKANATITLTGYVGTYDGTAHQATGTVVGILGESLSGLNLSNTSHTNAGTYIDTVTFTDVTGNYKNTIKNVKSTIYKANATLLLTGYSGVYDGMAHQATGTAVGILGESLSGLNLSNTSHTNAGTYIDTVTFTDVTGNYKNTIKNVKSIINKATATLTVTGYSVTFDGLPHTATGTATGVLGETLIGLDLSSTTHTNIGTYLDVVTFTDVTGNYKNTIKNVSSRIL